MVQYRLANGVMVQMLMTYEVPEPGLAPNDKTRIIGSTGIIEADHYGKVHLGNASGWTEVAEQVAFDFLGDYLDPNRLKGFAAQVEDFAGAILEDREPVVTGLDGRAAVEMVQAADRSAGTHAAVALPLAPGG
jgi:predicted dehydrogenase